MTGIDKIVFKLPNIDPEEYREWGVDDNGDEIFSGVRWFELIQVAEEQRRLTPYVRTVRGERGNFKGFEEMPGFLVKLQGSYRDLNPYVSRIEINPSHFASFIDFDRFVTVLNRTVNWVDHAQIARIDFAADYAGSMSDICHGIDFPNRRMLKFYAAIRNGERETMTVGSHPDVIIIYRRNRQLFVQGKLHSEDSLTPYVRIERQLRTAGRISDVLGGTLTYANLREQLSALTARGFNFYGMGVELGEVSLPEWVRNSPLARRQIQFETLARHNSYYEARKYLNQNGNFHRDYRHIFRREILPADQQPSGVFTAALNRFLTRRGGIRRPF